VTLGEKEVQIWFQNRRQNSRKKSKTSSSEQGPPSDDGAQNQPSSQEGLGIKISSTIETKETTAFAQDDAATESQPEKAETQSSTFTELTLTSSQSLLPSSQSSTGYIANRRSITARAEEEEVQEVNPTSASRTLARSNSSYLRLSLTDDGQAKIVDRGVSSPKKPLRDAASSRANKGLRRSLSVAGLDDQHTTQSSAARKVPRVSGRSRDSRTWEFWCDSDARNSLIERAEQENSGSAAEAIGMIRAKTNRALKTNTNKMNSPILGHATTAGPTKRARPPLKKSLTHVGTMSSEHKKSTTKKIDDEEDFEYLNEESDKENYDPDARPTAKSGPFIRTPSKVLGENDSVKSQSNSLGALMARERQAKDKGARSKVRVDLEVSSFMSSNRPTGSGSSPREEDLDCIQGLLSLSQGNWA
jgi:hypothetical protein